MASLTEIVDYTNEFLRIREVGDWDNALNGLQIENSGRVTEFRKRQPLMTRITRIGSAMKIGSIVLVRFRKSF